MQVLLHNAAVAFKKEVCVTLRMRYYSRSFDCLLCIFYFVAQQDIVRAKASQMEAEDVRDRVFFQPPIYCVYFDFDLVLKNRPNILGKTTFCP